MNQAKTFEALQVIADKIAAVEGDWVKAWQMLSSDQGGGNQQVEDLKDACSALNEEISKHVGAIAEVTSNAESTLRMAYAPKDDLEVWFSGSTMMPPSKFLSKVAKHRSFNTNFWASQEHQARRDAMFALIEEGQEVSSAEQAADLMAAGRAPLVLEKDAIRQHGLCPLEKAMLKVGLLESYDAHHADWVSTTKDVAFVVQAKDGSRSFAFWPQKTAHNRIDFSSMAEPEPSLSDAPRG